MTSKAFEFDIAVDDVLAILKIMLPEICYHQIRVDDIVLLPLFGSAEHECDQTGSEMVLSPRKHPSA